VIRRASLLVWICCLAGCGGGSHATQTTTAAKAKPRGLFAYDASAPLGIRIGRVVNPGSPIRVREFSYASPRGGRVSALLVLPPRSRGEGPFPAVVYMHGAGRDRTELLPFAVALADKGFVALTLSSPPAQPKGGIAGVRQFRDFYAHDAVNVRRAVDVLRSLPQVRDRPLGYVGFSYGAILGGIVSGVEHRIRAFDLMSGGANVGGVEGVPAQYRKEVERLLDSINPGLYVGHAAPSRLFFQDGLHDEVAPRGSLVALYQAASQPKQIRWYDAGHTLNAKAVDDQLAWLQKELR
jgi:cephalosporin-C deacetylase-like acetyl esterase